MLPTAPSIDDTQQWMTDCCQWGGKCRDCHCCFLALVGTGGNCGGKTIMTNEEEEANKTLPGTWLRLRKNNNQHVVGVRVGGIVIIMAWRQIPPCWRGQTGEKERPPLQQHDANNNNNKRYNSDSVLLALSS